MPPRDLCPQESSDPHLASQGLLGTGSPDTPLVACGLAEGARGTGLVGPASLRSARGFPERTCTGTAPHPTPKLQFRWTPGPELCSRGTFDAKSPRCLLCRDVPCLPLSGRYLSPSASRPVQKSPSGSHKSASTIGGFAPSRASAHPAQPQWIARLSGEQKSFLTCHRLRRRASLLGLCGLCCDLPWRNVFHCHRPDLATLHL